MSRCARLLDRPAPGTLLEDARFLPHVRGDAARLRAGASPSRSSLGLLIGVPLGAARFAGEVAEPILVALYSIPKVTLYPVILLIFGLGMPAKVAFGAIHGIVPISLFTMNAVRNINARSCIKTGARACGSRRSTWCAQILIPAALPEIFTGIRVGFSLDADRHAAGRDVRLAARPRLPADAGDRACTTSSASWR